jgi:hypothetical protein
MKRALLTADVKGEEKMAAAAAGYGGTYKTISSVDPLCSLRRRAAPANASQSNMNHEQIIRKAYKLAENVDTGKVLSVRSVRQGEVGEICKPRRRINLQ